MPTYQYACTECDHRFEAVQAFSDASLTTCPVCGGKLRKVYGSVGVVFKGSGFYRTDSRSGSVDAAAKSEKSDAKTDSTAKKGDSTPAKSSDSSSSTPAASGSSSASSASSSTGGGSSGSGGSGKAAS